ncbi:MAG: hypothetical protein F6J93_12105 [Oscillatoria sp. SIO1A7]|nr:hypothetical protein [Oscillatoria sp. SIO1A7]
MDDLKVNMYRDPRKRRPFTRHEVFVLRWLLDNSENPTYPKMMQYCKIISDQCQTAIAGLIQLYLLRQE